MFHSWYGSTYGFEDKVGLDKIFHLNPEDLVLPACFFLPIPLEVVVLVIQEELYQLQ